MKYYAITALILGICSINLQAQEENLEPVLDSTALPQVILKGTSIQAELKQTPAAVNQLQQEELSIDKRDRGSTDSSIENINVNMNQNS